MRDRTLKWALLTLGALNIADYLFTLRAVYILGVPEGNPYMDALLGTAWFAVVKLLLVPLGLYFIWRRRHCMGWLSHSFLTVTLGAYSWVTVYHIISQIRIG